MGRIRLFPLLFQYGCSQSSRFATAGQGEQGSGNEIATHVATHVGHDKRVEWFPISMYACDYFYSYGALIRGSQCNRALPENNNNNILT